MCHNYLFNKIPLILPKSVHVVISNIRRTPKNIQKKKSGDRHQSYSTKFKMSIKSMQHIFFQHQYCVHHHLLTQIYDPLNSKINTRFALIPTLVFDPGISPDSSTSGHQSASCGQHSLQPQSLKKIYIQPLIVQYCKYTVPLLKKPSLKTPKISALSSSAHRVSPPLTTENCPFKENHQLLYMCIIAAYFLFWA